VHEAVATSGESLKDADIYAAGPPQMITAIRAELPRHGANPARIVFDSFEYAPDTLSRMDEPSAQG
jgi:ferredoxin-NADP reductase